MLKKIYVVLFLPFSLLSSDVTTPVTRTPIARNDLSFPHARSPIKRDVCFSESFYAPVVGQNSNSNPEDAKNAVLEQIKQLPKDSSAQVCLAGLPAVNKAEFNCIYGRSGSNFKAVGTNNAALLLIENIVENLRSMGVTYNDPGLFSLVREQMGLSIDDMLRGDFHKKEAFVEEVANLVARKIRLSSFSRNDLH